MMIYIRMPRKKRSEKLEIKEAAHYHVDRFKTKRREDIRGHEIRVRDRIYMRGEWAFVDRIDGGVRRR